MPKNRRSASATPRGLVGVRGVVQGEEILILGYPHESPLQLDGLTPTEREIVAALVSGNSNAEIAAARGTSIRTVTTQVARALRKLGVASRGELAAVAASNPPPRR